MLYRPLNILLDSSSNLFDTRDFFDWKTTFIKAHSVDHLDRILKALPLRTRILIWIHLEGNSNAQAPPGLTKARRLRQRFPNLSKIIFLTSGYRTVHYDGLRPADQFCNFSAVLDRAEEEAPITVREVLRLPITGVKFNYKGDKYNWRINALKAKISMDTLSEMLHLALGNGFDQYTVDNLKPGYSGAVVLKVSCRGKGFENAFLLKISKDKADIMAEYEAAKNFGLYLLDANSYIGIAPLKEPIRRDSWYGLIYQYKENAQTMRTYLRANLTDATTTHSALTRVLDLLDRFQDLNPILRHQDQHPFHATTIDFSQEQTIDYKGLRINANNRAAILRQIEILEERYLNFQSAAKFELNTEKIEELKRFITENEHYVFTSDDNKKSTLTLTGLAQGDMHTANVLLEADGQRPSLIDFANADHLPNTHAMLDAGKLSSDLEISVLTEQLLLDYPAALTDWIAAHHAWINNQVYTGTLNPAIEHLYQLNTIIRNHLKNRYQAYELNPSETNRQLQMIRLHYFLKAIGYGTEIREKQVFFLKATCDILDFLK